MTYLQNLSCGLPWARVAATALLGLTLSQTPAWSAVALNENFRNTTATGWTLIGNASLTANSEGAGAGWLRLTSPSTNQIGSAIYNTPFSSSDGLQVTFTYATYGGTGADGMAFYLIDGSTATPVQGAKGAGLGYSTEIGMTGVNNGYLGVGFDEFGGFAGSNAGTCVHTGCNSPLVPNVIAVRGSGNGSSGFDLYFKQAVSSIVASRAENRRVRITVTPAPASALTVELDSGSGFVKVVDNLAVSSIPGQAAMPPTLKLGFSASTGGSTNQHEIRDLVMGGAVNSGVALSSGSEAACGPVQLTASVTPGGATGNVTFYDGSQVIGNGAVVGGQASLSATLTSGNHSLSAVYSGDGTYASSMSSALAKTVSANCPRTVPTLSEWGAAGLALLMGSFALLTLRRRRTHS